MRIRIDKSACVGNACCAAISDVLFKLGEDAAADGCDKGAFEYDFFLHSKRLK
jgi:ferredoxin